MRDTGTFSGVVLVSAVVSHLRTCVGEECHQTPGQHITTAVALRKLNVISQPVLGALTTASWGSVLRMGADVLAVGDLCTRPRQAMACSQAVST